MRASGVSEHGSDFPSTSGAGGSVESELRKEVTTLREQVLLCARNAQSCFPARQAITTAPQAPAATSRVAIARSYVHMCEPSASYTFAVRRGGVSGRLACACVVGSQLLPCSAKIDCVLGAAGPREAALCKLPT